MVGYIKLYRQLFEWEWYSDINTTRLFIHCLLKASHKDIRYEGVLIPKGSFVTGRLKLSQETNLTEQQVRTALKKLKSTNEITILSNPQYSIISINNWDRFQGFNQLDNQQLTNEQPTSNQPLTTYNNDKNVKNDNNVINISAESKKRDPYINPTKTFFLSEYEKVFGKAPFLSNSSCNKLVELSADIENIREIIPEALTKLKEIDFPDINFTPSASWLLKDDNFIRVMNDEFKQKPKKERQKSFEEIEQERRKALKERLLKE